MKKCLLFNLIQLLLLTAAAQNKTLIHVYRLQAAQAVHFYQGEIPDFTPGHPWLDELVDTTYRDPRFLPYGPGHYLMVSAEGTSLSLRLESISNHSLQMLNNGRDLAFLVLDTMGNSRNDLEVFLDKKRIAFDTRTGCYRLKKWNKEGFLEIRAPEDTAFFDVGRHADRSMFTQRYRRFSHTTGGYIVTTPVRWVQGVGHYFRRAFGWGDWRIGRRGYRKREQAGGYIALNKPLLRPGDTLKVKAHIVGRKGKPVQKPVRLTCSHWSGGTKVLIDTLLVPERPGSFVFEYIPGPEWELDREYYLAFDLEDERIFGEMTQMFRLEDYQLDEVRYELEPMRERFVKGEPVMLTARAEYFNGLPVADAYLKLVLTRGQVSRFYDSQVLVPDTLWKSEMPLDQKEPTVIGIPADIFPEVAMNVNVKGQFVNSNGEIQELSGDFFYDAPPLRLDLRVEEGYLIAEAFREGRPVATEALLEGYGNYLGNVYYEKKVSLPFRERVNGQIEYYDLSKDRQSVSLDLNENMPETGSGILLGGRRTADSIAIQASNPHRIPVQYLIRTSSGVIDEGKFDDPEWKWERRDGSDRGYFVSLNYAWGGVSQTKETILRTYDKLLSFQIDQPDRIEPGTSIPVIIRASGENGEPAKDVDLVAGAVNAQFGDREHYSGPSIRYRPKKEPLFFNSFEVEETVAPGHQQPISREWTEPLELKNELFYRLLLQDEGLYLEYDSVEVDSAYRNWAQFSPFLIDNGKFRPIYLIYCNGRLVYYYGTNAETPYSFAGRPGSNTIVLRGRDYEYQIEGLTLRKGWKLDFSLDENNYHEVPEGLKVTRRQVPSELAWPEKNRLTKSLLFVRRKYSDPPLYVREPGGPVHPEGSRVQRSIAVFGPFFYNQLYLVARSGFKRWLDFEPGFEYEIEAERERLYALNEASIPGKLPEYLNAPRPGQYLFPPEHISAEAPPRKVLEPDFQPWARGDGAGAYIFSFQIPDGRKDDPFGLVMRNETGRLKAYQVTGNQCRFEDLPSGAYELYLFLNSGTYLKHGFEVRKDTLLYQDLHTAEWVADSGLVLLRQFYYEPAASRVSLRAPTVSPAPIQTLYTYSGSGRLISGQVFDENGEALIGASILIKGTNLGTITDIDGSYALWAPEGDFELLVSYTGFGSQEISVDASTLHLNVSLGEAHSLLEEVVVTGRSVAVVERDAVSVATMLSGKAAGLSIDHAALLHLEIDDPQADQSGIATDREGLEGLRGDFRDEAAWYPNLVTDENGEAHFTIHYPDDITSWKTFVLGMDQKGRGGMGAAYTRAYKEVMAQLSLPRFLVEGDEAEIVGKALNYGNKKLDVKTVFGQEDRILAGFSHDLDRIAIDRTAVTAPDNTDSLAFFYRLQSDLYTDGESRRIPVKPPGALVVEGDFWVLPGDTILPVEADPALGPVTIRAYDNVLDQMLEDLEYLRGYPYECNEQTSSRLMALLMMRSVYELLHRPFDGETDIRKAIARLKKAQLPNGGWDWWPGGKDADPWMTAYVLEALEMAGEAGLEVSFAEKGYFWLDQSRITVPDLSCRLFSASRLFEAGVFDRRDTLFDEQGLNTLSLYQQLQRIRLRQLMGLDYSLETLKKYRQSTAIGGHFWGEEGYHWYENTVSVTLLAYEILRDAGKLDELPPIRQYFLAQRRNAGWRNTFETASILKTLLPDMMDEPGGSPLSGQLQIAGEKVTAFPYEKTFDPAERLTIRKEGRLPLFLTAYQEYQDRQPEAVSDIYQVNTRIEQAGPAGTLNFGEPAILKVRVSAEVSTDYAMIEVPIPAGCSYLRKTAGYSGPEVHREYYRDRVVIFCKKLPAGDHTFTIDLEPRFTGKYTLNPAEVKAMYFPTVNGRNELKRVEIR